MSDQPINRPAEDLAPAATAIDYQVAPNAPATFGGAIAATFRLYFEAFGPLFWLAAISAMISAMANNLAGFSLGPLLSLGALLATFYLTILGLQRADDVFRGRDGDDAVEVEGGLFFNVLGAHMGLALIMVLVFTIGAGPGLLISLQMANPTALVIGAIPGAMTALIVFVLFFLAHLVIIFERRELTEAFKRSYALVGTVQRWFFLYFLLLFGAILVAIPAVPPLLIAALVDDLIGTIVVTTVVHTAVFPFAVALSYIAFQSLLAQSQGPGHGRPSPPLRGAATIADDAPEIVDPTDAP